MVSLVEIRRNTPEFYQFMFFQCLGQRYVVEVVKRVDGRLQPVVILLVDQKTVQSLVYSLVLGTLNEFAFWKVRKRASYLVIQVLHRSQVRFYKL